MHVNRVKKSKVLYRGNFGYLIFVTPFRNSLERTENTRLYFHNFGGIKMYSLIKQIIYMNKSSTL